MRVDIAIPVGWRRLKTGAPLRNGDRWIDLVDVQVGAEWFDVSDREDPECDMVGERVGPGRVYDGSGRRVDGVPMIAIRKIQKIRT